MDWELLRTFDAVARHGSMTAAARALGISQSTVTRHLQQLEALAGSPLVVRGAELEFTARGVAVLASVSPMAAAAMSAVAALEEEAELQGEVSITTVGEVVRWFIVPAIGVLQRAHPGLRLTLLSDNRVASLASAEADIALRFRRPSRGDLVSRRLVELSYGLFVGGGVTPHASTPWLGLAGSLSGTPDAEYARRAFCDRPAVALVEDLESLALAVADGLGVAVLPTAAAGRFSDLRQVQPSDVGAALLEPPPPRVLWLVTHGARQRVPKVRAVQDWLIDLFA